MTADDGRWSVGIGDPTALGWATVAGYAAAATLCLMCARKERRGDRRWIFWQCSAGLLIALGINKQLDLQSLLTQLGRDLALAQGWYAYRRIVQVLFMAAATLGGIVALLVLYRWSSALGVEVKVASLGLAFLAVFVTVRAMSFHRVDQFLFHGDFGRLPNGILELGGIGCIAGSALYRHSRRRRSLR
jgi:hypothetical protein